MVRFDLVTLNGTKFSQEVHEVILPTAEGYIAIFPNHAPLVSLAVPGVITVRQKPGDNDTHLRHFATNGGVIEVGSNVVKVLVDEADNEEEINEQEVQKAIDAARKLRAEAKDQISLDHAQTLVDREASRLKVAELRRRKRR